MASERRLRILHCPDVVGGHAPQLARAERAAGCDSWAVSLRESRYAYDVDETLASAGRLGREWNRWRLLWRALSRFDVVHFNFGSSIFGRRTFDLPLLKKAGRRIFVTYQGDDARQGDYCRAHFRIHFAHEVPEGYYPAGSDQAKRRAIAKFQTYADGIYALNPDLLHVLPARAKFLPYANVDPIDWQPTGTLAGARGALRIVHAPSDRVGKGTRYVVQAVERLKAEGVALELVLVEGIARRDARELYERADLVVDQLLAGWYGGLAVEAMALGKPVVSYLRESDLAFIPARMREDMPVVSAEPDTVYDVLRRLANTGRESLRGLGMRGRAYVERWHDPRKIAAAVIDDYRNAYESA